VLFPNKDLKKLLIPLVIEQVLVMLVGMVDTVMVSQAGEAAVSGVALVDMINFLVITVLAALAAGGSIILSQYLGSRQPDKAEFSAGQLMTVTALGASGIMILCLLFRGPLLHLFFGTVEADVMDAALSYFTITACSFPFLGIYNAAAAQFRVANQASTIMYVSLLMNAINIVGDFVGVMVLEAGVLGVAFPTLISRAIAAVVMTALAFRSGRTLCLRWSNIRAWDGGEICRILRVAVPGGIENGLFALGKVLVVSIVSRFGTDQIAANGVANSICQMDVIVVNAVNLAMITVVGRCVGAREYDQSEYYTKKLMKVSYLSTIALGMTIGASLPLLLSFYRLSSNTLLLATELIFLHNTLAILLHPTSFNLPNSLRAAGDVKYTMYVGIGSMLVFRLGSAVLFGIVLDLGVLGVWIAMGMDWLARSVCFTLRYHKKSWQNCRVIA